MLLKAPFYIAKRYLVAKSSQNVINIINRITALVIVIGGASLFVVLAGFAGVKGFTVSFTTFFDPDLKILPEKGKFITIAPEKLQKITKISGVASYTQVLEEQVFLNHEQKNHIAYIKGVDDNFPNVNPVDSIIAFGIWDVSHPKIVVGMTIFNNLGLGFSNASSPLQIIAPKSGRGSITQTAKPYRETYAMVSGVYQITEDLDKKYVFSSLSEAQQLLGLQPNQISAIELKLKPNTNEKEVVKNIKTLFDNDVEVKNRMQLNDALYRMLNTENIAVYLIFTLVLIIALFNLVGALIIMLLDKREDLKTLFALGMSVQQLRRVFFMQGTIVSVIGAFLGVFLGLIIVGAQKQFQLVMISRHLPYPVEIEWQNVVSVIAIIVILGVLASLVASSRISKKSVS